MLKDHLPLAQVARLTGLTIKQLQQLPAQTDQNYVRSTAHVALSLRQLAKLTVDRCGYALSG